MLEENIWSHYGMWWAVAFWVLFYGAFLAFIPFYQKSQRKPASAYLAFVVAFAIEMHGIPMSMYFVASLLGKRLPEGIFWGHTLQEYIGLGGMYAAVVVGLTGAALVITGWRQIYKDYWSKESGKGKLVQTGIYRYIRHPQYTGFVLLTLAMLLEWATIPLLIMWPVLWIIYYRLARREEKDMEKEFGGAYADYIRSTPMFFPRLWGSTASVSHRSSESTI